MRGQGGPALKQLDEGGVGGGLPDGRCRGGAPGLDGELDLLHGGLWRGDDLVEDPLELAGEQDHRLVVEQLCHVQPLQAQVVSVRVDAQGERARCEAGSPASD